MEIFKLFGSIMVNTGDAEKSIQKTSNQAEGFASKLGNGIATAAKWGTAIVGATTAAAGAVVSFATKSSEASDHIDKMSQKIGISREAYQELDYICSQSGTSVDSLKAGMKTLTASMDKAKAGIAENVEQFERLGVAVTNSDGTFRSQEEVFFDTVAALQGVEDQTEKARLATQLLGRSGTELMPLLNGASGSIDEMKQQAHDLGLVLDDEVIDSGVSLKDTMDRMQRSFEAMAVKLGGAFMPIVENICNLIIDNMPTINSLLDGLTPILSELLNSMLPMISELASELLPPLVDIINAILPIAIELCKQILPIIVELIQILLPPLIQIVNMILPLLLPLIQQLSPILEPIIRLLEPILDLIVTLLEPLTQILNITLPILTALLETFAVILTDILETCLKSITKYINNTVVPLIDKLASKLTGFTSNVGDLKNRILNIFNQIKEGVGRSIDSLVSKFKTGFNSMKDAAKKPINAVIGFLNKLIKGINTISFDIPEWIPGGLGGKSFGVNLKTIPALAKGGTITGSGTVLVGEQGPEMLNLPTGASVTPLSGKHSQVIDYDELFNVFVRALATLIPYLGVTIEGDMNKFFREFRKRYDELDNMTGGTAYV